MILFIKGEEMKNKLILDGQAFKKMLSGVLLVTLCIMGSVEAKRRGLQATVQAGARPGTRAGQPVRRGGGRAVVRTPQGRQPQVQQGQNQPGAGAPVVQQPVIPSQSQPDQQELQTRISMLMSMPLSATIELELNSLASNLNLSSVQKNAIANYIATQKQLQAMQTQIEQLKKAGMREAVLPIGEVKIEKPAEKGWLASWFGYEPSQLTPTQHMAMGAAGALAAGTAVLTAGIWGPALAATAAYIGVKGALGLAGTAYTVSTIKFALKTGAMTTPGAIALRKIELGKTLTGGRYPTFELQLEALRERWRAELLATGEDLNDNIFVSACIEMADDIKKLAGDRTPEAEKKDKLINDIVTECRNKNYTEGTTPQQYIENIRKELLGNALNTPEQLSAYNSELERAQKRINLEVAQYEARIQSEKEAEALKVKAKEAASAAVGAAKGVAGTVAGKVGSMVGGGNQPPATQPAPTQQINPFSVNETPPALQPKQSELTPVYKPVQQPVQQQSPAAAPAFPGPKFITPPPAQGAVQPSRVPQMEPVTGAEVQPTRITPEVLPKYPTLEEKPVVTTGQGTQASQTPPASGQQQAGKKTVGLVGKVKGLWENLPSGY